MSGRWHAVEKPDTGYRLAVLSMCYAQSQDSDRNANSSFENCSQHQWPNMKQPAISLPAGQLGSLNQSIEIAGILGTGSAKRCASCGKARCPGALALMISLTKGRAIVENRNADVEYRRDRRRRCTGACLFHI